MKGDVCLRISLPVALERVPAGFPSPAQDFAEEILNIAEFLVKQPKTTFFMRVVGDSMIGAGINDGDLLVIDRAAPIADKTIVVAIVDGEMCVKEFRKTKDKAWLASANPDYPDIEFIEGREIEIWGRVMHSVTHHCLV